MQLSEVKPSSKLKMTNIADAQPSLLLAHVLAGEEVILADAGKPVAKLVPYSPSQQDDATDSELKPEEPLPPRDLDKRIGDGEIWIADDFDELPQEIMQYFTGENTDEDALFT